VANPSCLNQTPTAQDRSIVAGSALLGGLLGFVGGVLATRHGGNDGEQPPPMTASATMPIATFAPMRATDGSMVPAFAAMGAF
jgi:hypothetical protein